MKASEYIEELAKLIQAYGDLDMQFFDWHDNRWEDTITPQVMVRLPGGAIGVLGQFPNEGEKFIGTN